MPDSLQHSGPVLYPSSHPSGSLWVSVSLPGVQEVGPDGPVPSQGPYCKDSILSPQTGAAAPVLPALRR